MTTRKLVLLTIVAALAVSGFLFLVAVPLLLIAMFAAIVVAIGGLIAVLGDPDEPRLPDLRTVVRGGTRREVTQVAWTLSGSRGKVGPGGSERLRAIAAVRLRRRGLDLADAGDQERVAALLGPLAYRVVSAPSIQPIAALRETIRAIERLDDPPAGSPTTPVPTAGDAALRRTA